MMINVTEPFLPPIDELLPYLSDIWGSKRVSNNGELAKALEVALCQRLGVSECSATNNGTSALMAGLAALDLQGEVVTTPFSFVASVHAIKWSGLPPVFADIDPMSLTLDASAVEQAITAKTSAILAVNVYGRPCQFGALADLARRHGLKLIYDSAHAFGVEDELGTVLRHGDLNIMSFHATKVFHTLEGGAVISNDRALKARVDRIRNFGFESELQVSELGLNAKLNELQAAVGLLNLKYLAACIDQRKRVHAGYRQRLNPVEGIVIPEFPAGYRTNYAYFPIFVTDAYPIGRDDLHSTLEKAGVLSRRYFFPLLSDIPMYKSHPSAAADRLPAAQQAARTVLCLPMHVNVTDEQIDKICACIAAPLESTWAC